MLCENDCVTCENDCVTCEKDCVTCETYCVTCENYCVTCENNYVNQILNVSINCEQKFQTKTMKYYSWSLHIVQL